MRADTRHTVACAQTQDTQSHARARARARARTHTHTHVTSVARDSLSQARRDIEEGQAEARRELLWICWVYATGEASCGDGSSSRHRDAESVAVSAQCGQVTEEADELPHVLLLGGRGWDCRRGGVGGQEEAEGAESVGEIRGGGRAYAPGEDVQDAALVGGEDPRRDGWRGVHRGEEVGVGRDEAVALRLLRGLGEFGGDNEARDPGEQQPRAVLHEDGRAHTVHERRGEVHLCMHQVSGLHGCNTWAQSKLASPRCGETHRVIFELEPVSRLRNVVHQLPAYLQVLLVRKETHAPGVRTEGR